MLQLKKIYFFFKVFLSDYSLLPFLLVFYPNFYFIFFIFLDFYPKSSRFFNSKLNFYWISKSNFQKLTQLKMELSLKEGCFLSRLEINRCKLYKKERRLYNYIQSPFLNIFSMGLINSTLSGQNTFLTLHFGFYHN